MNMKFYRKEFNYIIYYSDSTNKMDDLHFCAEKFGQDKIQGIFKLTLGRHFPEILFLPKIENIHKFWPPNIDYQSIQSTEDICISLILGGPYIVMPCNEWSGEVKIIDMEVKNPTSHDTDYIYKSTVFFITEREYETYYQEAKKIEELNDDEYQRDYEIFSQTRTEELEKYMEVPIFIKDKVIPYFDDSDLYNISRKKDENGNIIFTQTIASK